MTKLCDFKPETADRLLDAWYSIPAGERGLARFVMRRETFEAIRNFEAADGSPLVDHWDNQLRLDETRFYIRGVVIECTGFENPETVEVLVSD